MCGIAGILNFNKPLQHAEPLMLMTESMANRGPDDEGYMLFSDTISTHTGNSSIIKTENHINSTFSKSFKVGFGFRQLKIIDLSNKSHQPMMTADKKYCVIFNGEIYNFKELRAQLINKGYTFYSNSDTEVLLYAYVEWKEKVLHKLNGMFAFSILDTVKNEVFIARDRIGIKPLYYYKNNNQFIFGSTMLSIIKSKLYKPEINWQGLWQNFRFSVAQRPNTSFKNINALEPAHYLKINLYNNEIQKTQYWQIPTNTQDFSLSENQCSKLIEEGLTNAINYRLIADVNLGTFMSGGIDSSLLAVLASKKDKNLTALTLGYKDYVALNEVKEASETAQLHNLNHKIHQVHASDAIKNLEQMVVAYEEPYHHIAANFILAKIASNNKLKVMLSGLGGDELFGGYDVYNKIDLWQQLKKHKNIVDLLPKINQKIKKGKQLATYNTLGEFYSHYYTTFNDAEIASLFKEHSYNTTHLIENLYLSNHEFTDTFEAMSFYNLKSYIGNHQMRALDHTMMAFSVEGRFPLLDHHFIEAAFKIPTKYKLKNGTQKYILKQVAKKHIAPSSFKMNKKGLTVPLKHWVTNDLKEIVYDSLSALKNRQLFNNTAIDSIAKSNDETKIWQLVSTELWLQNFID